MICEFKLKTKTTRSPPFMLIWFYFLVDVIQTNFTLHEEKVS